MRAKNTEQLTKKEQALAIKYYSIYQKMEAEARRHIFSQIGIRYDSILIEDYIRCIKNLKKNWEQKKQISYIKFRLRGATVDFQRRNAIVPRTQLSNLNKYREILAEHPNCTDKRLLKLLNITKRQLIRIKYYNGLQVYSLNARLNQNQYEHTEPETLGDKISDGTNIHRAAENKDLCNYLLGNSLTKLQRRVIEDFFYTGLSITEIAKDLKVSPSRVCQIKDKALSSMRACLREEGAMASF